VATIGPNIHMLAGAPRFASEGAACDASAMDRYIALEVLDGPAMWARPSKDCISDYMWCIEVKAVLAVLAVFTVID
jgi:hypothetical protein